MCDLNWYKHKAQNIRKTHHTLNVNTKVNFVLEHNISRTSKTPSDALWTLISWAAVEIYLTITFKMLLAFPCLGRTTENRWIHKGSIMRSFRDFVSLFVVYMANQIFEQTTQLQMIWDAIMPMWRHCNFDDIWPLHTCWNFCQQLPIRIDYCSSR